MQCAHVDDCAGMLYDYYRRVRCVSNCCEVDLEDTVRLPNRDIRLVADCGECLG